MKLKKLSLWVLLSLGLGLTQLYQNCGQLPGLEADGFGFGESASMSLDMNHPPTAKQTDLPTRKQLVVPRSYVAALFREIFTSTTYPVANLEVYIDKWVMYKGGQFGGACSLYTSYSTRDCNGSLANTNLPAYSDDNTMRESFRVQLCENLLGQDAGVNAALEKVGLTNASPVSAPNVVLIYGLFYRNDPPAPEIIATLLDLDGALRAQNAKPIDRWRALLSQVCESPSWQLF